MNLFFNQNGIGDVLIVTLKNDAVAHTKETDGIVQLFNVQNELIGVNLFQASTYFKWLEDRHLDKQTYKQEVCALLANRGIDVELSTDPMFVVGHVNTCEKHPDSEKLSVCQVDIGQEVLQIVCGAKNIAQDQYVVVARPGAQLLSGLFIVPSVLRKVASNGMICSKKELHVKGESEGILVLPKQAIGQSFYETMEME